MTTPNLPELMRRYLAHETGCESIDKLAKSSGISRSTLEKAAIKGKWVEKRKALDARAEKKAIAKLEQTQSQKIAKVKAGWLKIAEDITKKMNQTLRDKKERMTMFEVLRAAREITNLQAKAHGIGGVAGLPGEDGDGSVHINATQINLSAPSETPDLNPIELTDDQLAKYFQPRLAARIVDARVAPAGEAAKPAAGSGRAPKKARGKK